MPKLLYFLLFSLVVFFLFTTCEPEPIPIDLKTSPQKLVIFSHTIGDSILVVSVSKTFASIDKKVLKDSSGEGLEKEIDKIMVKNAEVEVESEGEKIRLKTSKATPGFYYGFFKIITNKRVTLNVTDPDTKLSVKAVTTNLSSVPLKHSYLEDIEGDQWVNIEFQDPAEVKNFYLLSYFKLGKDQKEEKGEEINTKTFELNTRKKVDYFLFDDSSVKEGNYAGKFLLEDVEPTDSVVITFSNITEGYYKFLEAKKQSNNFLSSILNEPYNFPSNVEGGYGYFNTHFTQIKIVDQESKK